MALPEPAVEAGVVIGATILFVFARYFRNVSKNPDISFSVTKSGKTLLLGLVGGAIAFMLGNGTGGDALSMAIVMAVPIVDSLWNQFSSTWDHLDQNDDVQEFEETADEMVDEHGDEAAEKMDETRGELTGDNVAGNAQQTTDEMVSEMQAEVNAVGEKVPGPNTEPVGKRVNDRVDAIPHTYDGYQKLRRVAGLIPSIDGNTGSSNIRNRLKSHERPHTVLDAFATVEARDRGERRVESGGESV